MIRLKKKQAEAKAAEEAAAAEAAAAEAAAGEGGAAADGAAAEGGEPAAEGETKKVSLLGIGGKKVAKSGTATKKKTPGEIRIQKDIAELDGGDVAKISFPNPNDLTSFNVDVTPDTGFWKVRSHLVFGTTTAWWCRERRGRNDEDESRPLPERPPPLRFT